MMEREQLIGTWRCLSSVYELRPDGTATITTDDQVEQADWQWVDSSHWKLRLRIPPDPSTPGLEEGAVHVEEFEVIEVGPAHFRATTFDYEFDFLFSRIG